MYSLVSVIKPSALLICILLLFSCNTSDKKDANEIRKTKGTTKSNPKKTDKKEIAIDEKQILLDSIYEIKDPKAKKIALGKLIYKDNCALCHQNDGKGKTTYFPPLRNSDFFANNPEKAIKVVLGGHSGPIIVNGEAYNLTMKAQNLNDEEIASVITYVLNIFNNSDYEVKADEVAEIRNK